ncbi:DICT sensory domain-containing protein [Rhodococcoides kroppenstedtii]|uniref:DICT sensory domain-containing protein n=1 Tax=Rhodococcoides kroppenstedtii TaxID=293050 RepID=UPI0030B8A0AB
MTRTHVSELLGVEVQMQFAPVRRLEDGALAGAELQVRGPSGTALGTASALRHAAQLMGQRADLDEYKHRHARTPLARTVADHLPLLVTIDSESPLAAEPATEGLERTIVTVDATDVLRNPHRALARVVSARASGRLVALDGVGVDVQAATLLSLIEPDIVVTAAELHSGSAGTDIGATAHALSAYVERSHAVIVAEGIDDDAARLAAQTVGATYGIGALYPPVDDPAGLLTEDVVPMPHAPVWTTPIPAETTPYAIASEHATPRRGTKRVLVQMSKSLEKQAVAAGSAMLALGTFQHATHFTERTAQRWRHLADTIGFAGVYGVGLTQMLDGNTQHAPLDPADDMVNEWTVVVLGPHHAALLSARDRHDNGPDLERTFDFVQTYDRTTVTQAAHAILHRFTP